jgi:hypothetical protein
MGISIKLLMVYSFTTGVDYLGRQVCSNTNLEALGTVEKTMDHVMNDCPLKIMAWS